MTKKLLRVANDLGNDTAKMFINDKSFNVPSVIGTETENVEAPHFETKAEKDTYMKNFFNHIEVSVASPNVSKSNKFLLGQNAINSRASSRRFDINNFSGKSQDDLSLMLTLSTIAGARVQDAYFAGEDLKKTLNTDVVMTTALPIQEGKKPGVIKNYTDKYLNADHLVTFYNLGQMITVKIHFVYVLVTLEGQAAQITISNAPVVYPKLAEMLKDDLIKHYPKLKNVTAQMIAGAKNTLGIDIGGKTVDFPVIMNGQANIKVSASAMHGYDNVLLLSIDQLQAKQRNFETIGQLESYIQEGANPFDPDSYEQVTKVIGEASNKLKTEIINNTSKVIGSSSLNPSLVFVYGGGSIPMQRDTDLREELATKLRSFNAGHDIPIVWVPKEMAQKLNLMGLKLLLDAICKRLGLDKDSDK